MASCGCFQHNGFLIRKGYLMSERDERLTGGQRPVKVDRSVSVSVPESEAEPASSKEKGSWEPAPPPGSVPGEGEVTDGS